MRFSIGMRLRRMTTMLVLMLLLLPATSGGRVHAQADGIIGEWEITVEILEGEVVATWIGRVWVSEGGVETLFDSPNNPLIVDISNQCTVFGDPFFGRSFVDLDGEDDYIACTIPPLGPLFGQITPILSNCRCRFDGPPYAAADVSPVLTTVPQTVIYHNLLQLEILQREDVADLELAQGVSTIGPDVGERVAFSLTVTNRGPATATGVTVEDRLPTGYTYVEDDSGGTYDTVSGIWTVGTLAPGASATLQLSVTTNETGVYDNVAQVVSSNELDPDSIPNNLPADEDDNATANMAPAEDSADLELAKGVSNIAPGVGATVAFSLTVLNRGPDAATGVTVEDQLPTGYTYVEDDSGGAYDAVSGIWTVGTLGPDTSATLLISVTANASGVYTNVAQVAGSDVLDPDSTPNNLPVAEDDSAMAAIMDPTLTKIRFPVVMTGEVEQDGAAASVAATTPLTDSTVITDTYGQAQLTLWFRDEEGAVSVVSHGSNVFVVPQDNGIQMWGGYNALRYVTINDPEGFGDFLSVDGFWDAVEAGDFVEGLFLWESEAQQKYVDEPRPGEFFLSGGTVIYIGYNPATGSYFEGAVRAASVDPGCRGH